MNDMNEIRVKNLTEILEEFKKMGYDSYAKLHREFGVDQSYLSQIMTGRRNLGEKSARNLERMFRIEPFFLDSVDGNSPKSPKNQEPLQKITSGAGDNSGSVFLPVYDVKVACGLGYENSNVSASDAIDWYEISEDALAERQLPINGDGLIVTYASGDSMTPTIPNGAKIVINTKENDYTSLVSGRVYAFSVGNEMICKRAYKNLDGKLTLMSDNPDKEAHPNRIIDRDCFDMLSLVGRIRMAVIDL